jgi:hypothetical protein
MFFSVIMSPFSVVFVDGRSLMRQRKTQFVTRDAKGNRPWWIWFDLKWFNDLRSLFIQYTQIRIFKSQL